MDEKNISIALAYFYDNCTRPVSSPGLYHELHKKLDGVSYQQVLTYFSKRDWIDKTQDGNWLITDAGKDAHERRSKLKESEIEQKETELEILALSRDLMRRQIDELDRKDEIIKTQSDQLEKATTRTVRSTLFGAVIGAVITGLLSILQANTEPDTIVLPSIQLIHDTMIEKQTDTVYLTDSLLKE